MYNSILKSATSQISPANSSQVKNNAGGYVFQIDKWAQLRRFLILGSASGSYYVQAAPLTKECANVLADCIEEDQVRVVNEIVDISERGLSHKEDALIFALAFCAAYKVGNKDYLPCRQTAMGVVEKVARYGTTFFQFLEELKAMRSLTGRAVQRMVDNWYTHKTTDELALQVVKYRSRNGWTHRDALRIGHTSPKSDEVRNAIFQWVVKEGSWPKGVSKPKIIEGHEKAFSGVITAKEASILVTEYDLPREALPTHVLKDPSVWMAMLPHMGLTALIRNLGNMTSYGVLTNTSKATEMVIQKLSNRDYIKKARIHPVALLYALRTYTKGSGVKGSNSWTPVQSIVSALDKAFYMSFEHTVTTGKNVLVGLDISGSMGVSVGGILTAAEIGAAMSMYFLKTEPMCTVMGFAKEFRDLGLNSQMDLSTVMQKTSNQIFGSTDCSLPMIWAKQKAEKYDLFIVITDSETYAGRIHPFEALKQYRSEFVKDARLCVLATTASKFSIADPSDPGMLDIAGFSPDVPTVIQQFMSGELG